MPVHHRESPSKNGMERHADDVDDEDDYDGGNRNIILSLIGQLRPGSDLSRITSPTFILERKSMLERITNLSQHPDILAKASSVKDPEQRFVDVVRWYMSGWHIAPKAVKKPLNPVLGEYFSCYWDLKDNTRAYYIAEQTSHHAPKSSFFFTHPSRQIRADGIVIPKSRFLGNSAASMMEGISLLTFGEHVDSKGNPEVYEITQPNIYARNIIVGTMKLEMGDKAYVRCPNSDMECTIDFKVKGYISGTYNEIKGTITHAGKPLYESSGKWNEVIYIKDLVNGKKKEVFFDVSRDTVQRPLVRPIDEQGKMESRRLWEKVCIALGERNQKVATDEKYDIEEHQRHLQKSRSEGVEPPFQPKLFKPVDDPSEFKIFVDEESKKARSVQEVEELLKLVMPITPGTKFPANFDAPASEKAKHLTELYKESLQSGNQESHTDTRADGTASTGSNTGMNPGVASKTQVLEYDGDEFVDAPGSF